MKFEDSAIICFEVKVIMHRHTHTEGKDERERERTRMNYKYDFRIQGILKCLN